MKAIVIHQYGEPANLQLEEYPDPVAGPGEVLVQVAATSVNPIDYKMRSGQAKAIFPVQFPGILGVDLSGTVVRVGPGVSGFAVGDKVFGMATRTYAQLCAVKAASLAKVPDGLDLVEAAALPLVTTTGEQVISKGAAVGSGKTVLVTGALGGVGRSAVFTAKQRGATVIAGVRKKQLDEAKNLGADQVIATDDEAAIAKLPPLDAVADAVGGKTGAMLLGKVAPGGIYASVLGPPSNAADFPKVRVVPVVAQPDPKTFLAMARAVMDGKLRIPIDRKLPLAKAGEGQAAAEKGGIGKVILVV